jgi:transposase
MLSWESVVEVHALRKQGWSIAAIARHVGATRLTVRRYLSGERVPGQRVRTAPDPFEEFASYCRLRLAADPHLWATTLYEEVVALGYGGSYPSFTRGLRARSLRPRCTPCASVRTKDRAIIEHPPGAETQWDWVELPNPPAGWGWGATAYVLVGALPHSSRWRGWLSERTDTGHLVEGLDQVVRRLGGVTARWRFDRMSTVYHPGSGRLRASFGPVAMHYGVGVDLCPPGHGWRKGVVEKAVHVITQRWWRTLPDDATLAFAQASLDAVCARLDGRRRVHDSQATTVGALAEAEPLRPAPAPFPATVEVERVVRTQALVAFRGNRYSVPPGHAGATVLVRHRLGGATLDVVTARGVLLAHHLRAPDGAGSLVRLGEHVTALQTAVLGAFTDRGPCRRKDRQPPSPAASAEADRIRRARAGLDTAPVVVDFAAYAAAARPLGHSPSDGNGDGRAYADQRPGEGGAR